METRLYPAFGRTLQSMSIFRNCLNDIRFSKTPSADRAPDQYFSISDKAVMTVERLRLEIDKKC